MIETKYVVCWLKGDDRKIDLFLERVFNQYNGKIQLDALEAKLIERFNFNALEIFTEKEILQKRIPLEKAYLLRKGMIYENTTDL